VCAKGYMGPLCNLCTGKLETGEYFARTSGFECAACPEKGVIWLKVSGLLVFVLVYIALLVVVVIKTADRRQKNSALLRIITSYI